MYKRKIIIAISILLICLILLMSVSYAWLSLSLTPEVSGIDTHIGANGSLEMALLSDSTYLDPSLIRTAVGNSSAVVSTMQSNLYWGSMVDLTDEGYGLGKITLLPSRLNVRSGGDGTAIVGSNMLVIPEYGADGRFDHMITDTVSATYQEEGFIYSTEYQNYGVRGIGTASQLSIQQSALANARSVVKAYTSASVSSASSVWQENGAAVLRIYCNHYINGSDSFTSSDIAMLRDAAIQMQNAISYVDLALRQGIVGYAASVIEDADDFKTVRSAAENTFIPLSAILSSVSVELPGTFSQWITTVENDKKQMQTVIASCNALKGDNFTWEQISPLVNAILNENEAYLGQVKLSSMDSSTQLTADNVLTISPQAGIMADIADFSGNYNVFFTYIDSVSVEVGSTSRISTPHLVVLSAALDECQAPSNNGTVFSVPLNQVYGYAIDMAFRCNQGSNLLLQTVPTQRLGTDSEDAAAQGAGSFMRFTSEQLKVDGIVRMMDAIRIGFVDNQNHLLGVAKLNTSNYVETDEGVVAALYLYDYDVSMDGSISMGERREAQSAITELPQNTPVVITAVVWLDGDHVDNTLSAAITAQSMTGVLNLQFSSSATLNPSEYPLMGEG